MKMEESKTFFGTDFTDYTVKTGGFPQSRHRRDARHPPSAEAGLKKGITREIRVSGYA